MYVNIYKKESKPAMIAGMLFKSLLLSFLISIVAGFVLGIKYFTVTTDSMAPTMPVGTLIAVSPIKFENVKPGDVVTTKRGESHLTHRAIGYELGTNNVITATESVWIQDLNRTSVGHVEITSGKITHEGKTIQVDSPVTRQNYVGVVTLHIKDVGKLILAIKKHTLTFIIGAVLVIFVISFI